MLMRGGRTVRQSSISRFGGRSGDRLVLLCTYQPTASWAATAVSSGHRRFSLPMPRGSSVWTAVVGPGSLLLYTHIYNVADAYDNNIIIIIVRYLFLCFFIVSHYCILLERNERCTKRRIRYTNRSESNLYRVVRGLFNSNNIILNIFEPTRMSYSWRLTIPHTRIFPMCNRY